ncbi:MAG: hypothetical protein WDZ83_02920 [Rhizobiaceae bacterium]
MSDERMARPVSGEIMTDGHSDAGTRPQRAGADDIIDAEFETIVPEQKPASRAQETRNDDMPADAGGMDMLRGSRTARSDQRTGGPVFWIVGLALVFGAFWVSGGHAIVSRNDTLAGETATATPFQQPLRIVNVVSRIDRRGERAFLLVDGEVANPGEARSTVPPLAIIVTGLDGRETRYYLGTNEKVLAPGERFAFSSRLHAPNEGVRTVTVDFRKGG